MKPTSPSPRIRIFAGPNGSGKTTLVRDLKKEINLYKIINPDDLYQDLINNSILELSPYEIQTSSEEFYRFIKHSTYEDRIKDNLLKARIEKNILIIDIDKIDTYQIALVAAFLRDRMLKNRISFSFETVLSHPSKVEFLKKAEQSGYHNYLYFIATANTVINVDRVAQRVAEKGHSVPKNKIISRYPLSLDNLLPALKYSYRAYIFDNSGESSRLISELTPKRTLLLKTSNIPIWFDKYVIQKLA